MKTLFLFLTLVLPFSSHSHSLELHHVQIRTELYKNDIVSSVIKQIETKLLKNSKCDTLTVSGQWEKDGYSFQAISGCITADGAFIGIDIKGNVYNTDSNYPVITQINFDYAG